MSGSFDDPRGLAGRTRTVTFGSPVDMSEIVFSALREPVGHRVVVGVAFDVMAKGFTVEEEAEKPNPEWSRLVSKVLDGLNAKEKLRELVLFERLYGWAALGLSIIDYGADPSKPVQNPRQVLSLTVFSDHNCTIQSSDEEKSSESERCGLPNFYTVKIGSKQKKIHFTRMIHFASRRMGHPWRGVPALVPLYSDLTAYRNAREQIVHTIKTHAGGFADITVRNKKSQRQLEKFEQDNDLSNLDSRTRFVHDENVGVQWIGAAGRALNPEPYVDVSLQSLSCGSRIPKSHLEGATAGTIAGSEVNDREYWGGIAMQQSLLDPTVWVLIDQLMLTGQIPAVEDYNLVWPSGFELSETTLADIRLKEAQTRALQLKWMTKDEVRAEAELLPLLGGAGAQVDESEDGEEFGANSVGLFGRVRNWFRRRRAAGNMVSEVVAEYLKGQLPSERVYEVGVYYPGELPYCLRRQYFRFTLPKALGGEDEQLFGVGYLWQATIKEALDAAGIQVLASQKIHRLKVPDSDLVLVCEPDFELEVAGRRVVLEAKSTNRLPGEPLREHVLQLMPYVKVCRADSGLLLYVSKQSGETREFPVSFDPESLVLVFERAKRLDAFLRGKKLPARCGAGQDWQCRNCEYLTECETFGDGIR